MTQHYTSAPRANYRQIPGLVADRKDFEGNSMSAHNVKPGSHNGSGHLDSFWQQKFFAASDRIDYIVWSYGTPIAWHTTDGEWTKVTQKFSVTTSRHQGNLYLI